MNANNCFLRAFLQHRISIVGQTRNVRKSRQARVISYTVSTIQYGRSIDAMADGKALDDGLMFCICFAIYISPEDIRDL